jgi:hypothetical protein
MVSYAASAEDVVLHRALCRGRVGVGRYVDVGASSPYLSSVTRHFYDAGWSGIDVEPLAEEALGRETSWSRRRSEVPLARSPSTS